MPKTDYWGGITLSINSQRDFRELIDKIRHKPVALYNLLSELEYPINSKKFSWILDTYADHPDPQYNLGIVLALAQVRAACFYPSEIQKLQACVRTEQAEEEADLEYARVTGEKPRLHKKNLFGWPKKLPSEKTQKKLDYILDASEKAANLCGKYLDILSKIKIKSPKDADNILCFIKPKGIQRDSLGVASAYSMLHIAIINKDLRLVLRFFGFINCLIQQGADIKKVYDLFAMRFIFLNNAVYRPHSGKTIGHCLFDDMPRFTPALYSLLLLFMAMLQKGIVKSDIRSLMVLPKADIPQDCINNHITRYFPLLSPVVQNIYLKLDYALREDYCLAEHAVQQPVVTLLPPAVLPAPPIEPPLQVSPPLRFSVAPERRIFSEARCPEEYAPAPVLPSYSLV